MPANTSEIKTKCPHCDQPLSVESAMAGQAIDCPACGKSVQLPEALEKLTPPPMAISQMPSYVRKSGPVAVQPSAPPVSTNCPNCGVTLASGTRFCASCGTATTAVQPGSAGSDSSPSAQGTTGDVVYPPNPPRSPHLAWLSILGAGLPQIVLGQTWKGIWMIMAFNIIVTLQVGAASDSELAGWEGRLSFIRGALTIASIVDGYMVGKRLLRGQTVGKWQFFPRA